MELKDNSVELTEEGIGLAKMALETNDLWDENIPGQGEYSYTLIICCSFNIGWCLLVL